MDREEINAQRHHDYINFMAGTGCITATPEEIRKMYGNGSTVLIWSIRDADRMHLVVTNLRSQMNDNLVRECGFVPEDSTVRLFATANRQTQTFDFK